MTAHFRVKSTFVINSLSRFVLGGVITDGIIRQGDYVCAPFNLGVPVVSIEFILLRSWTEEPALTFHYRSAEELALWQRIDWIGQELEMTDSPEAAGPVLTMSDDR